MFTKPSKYAIKAICLLVDRSSETHKLLVKDIARETGVPSPFLSKILQTLSRRGFISSHKGRHGGFYLSADQREVLLLDIILELEGKDHFQHCIMNFENCNLDHPCPVHELIAPAKVAFRKSLEGIRLKDLG
ncbi:MAG: Rrf2 family transcriptional regulator [Bacteroidota bacterium]